MAGRPALPVRAGTADRAPLPLTTTVCDVLTARRMTVSSCCSAVALERIQEAEPDSCPICTPEVAFACGSGETPGENLGACRSKRSRNVTSKNARRSAFGAHADDPGAVRSGVSSVSGRNVFCSRSRRSQGLKPIGVSDASSGSQRGPPCEFMLACTSCAQSWSAASTGCRWSLPHDEIPGAGQPCAASCRRSLPSTAGSSTQPVNFEPAEDERGVLEHVLWAESETAEGHVKRSQQPKACGDHGLADFISDGTGQRDSPPPRKVLHSGRYSTPEGTPLRKVKTGGRGAGGESQTGRRSCTSRGR